MTAALEVGEGVSFTPRPLFTPGKDPVPIVQEAGWVPRPVWTGAENLAPSGIRSPDRPPRSQSLYRLSYPAHIKIIYSGGYINGNYWAVIGLELFGLPRGPDYRCPDYRKAIVT